METRVLPGPEAAAREAARVIAAEARAAVTARGRFLLAVSGGRTPWRMLRLLEAEDVPWDAVHLVQVDERVAPEGDSERNLTHLLECLPSHAPVRPERIHAMPVGEVDLEAAARRPFSISCTSGSVRTDTLLRWSPATRCWTSPATTSRSPGPTRA